MENTPKVSVIVPVYKVEPYLRKCLDSIVNQTYRNLEIILVDDGSPDNCGAICDEYAARDSRIKVIHKKNGGVYAARNCALDIAQGDYIGFVDGDDWIEPGMYEALLRLLLDTDTDISQCEMENEGNYAQLRSIIKGDISIYTHGELTVAMFREEISHGLPNKLFKASVWRHMRFDERFYHVDAMTISKIEQYCERFARMDAVLYHYNTSNPSITRGPRNPMHIQSAEQLFTYYSAAVPLALDEGSFFLCKEIPSTGRLIPPGEMISCDAALRHIFYMHDLFMKHWPVAKTTYAYHSAPNGKKILWRFYSACPVLASMLVYIRSFLKRQGEKMWPIKSKIS